MKTRTLYCKTHPTFGLKFDPETGEETVSFFVSDIGMSCMEYAAEQEDAKGVLKYYACCWLGRHADLERCTHIAVREHEDTQRVEIRLRFGPPWYWSLIQHGNRQYADRKVTADAGTVGPVQQ